MNSVRERLIEVLGDKEEAERRLASDAPHLRPVA